MKIRQLFSENTLACYIIRPAAAFVLLLLALMGGSVVSAQSGGEADQLDRDFYNEYLDSVPDEWAPDPLLLQANLFASLKRVLPREDPFESEDYLKSLKPEQLEYKRVTNDSPFVRGLFKEAPYLKQTGYMWIIRSGPYLVFLSYTSDPQRYTIAEYQNLVIKKGDAKKDKSEHKSEDEG